MRKIVVLLALALAAVLPLPTWAAPTGAPPRVIQLFDDGWRFLPGDAPGAEKAKFDDATWRVVAVPHDWSIEGPIRETNPTGGAGAFLSAGVGWYRKHFTLPAPAAGRRVSVEFDGIMAHGDVWINGTPLGNRPSGWVGVRYDLTPSLHTTGDNVLAVRADNSRQPASRWYAGAGIYRHVRLVITNAVHLAPAATFVTTPNVASAAASVDVATTITNDSGAARPASLEVTLIGPEGVVVGTGTVSPRTVPSGASVDCRCRITVAHPRLWGSAPSDVDQPMYRAVLRVRSVAAAMDDETVPFGIRECHFDAATGFSLNGRALKIKGVCLHEDAGGLGAAVPLRIWKGRLLQLRQVGCNAIRTAHNPPAPEFLDLCDQMGFLVMDEMFDTWTVGKEPYDYHLDFAAWSARDIRDTVRRDRNHPGVILYSIGNEIRDTPNADLARRTLITLRDMCHANDPTRPVTQALFRPNASHDYENGLADLLDVIGQNYRESELLAAHAARPTRKIIGTEDGHDRREWLAVRDNPAFSGQFLWTGFDYLGEARAWPTIGSASGLFDRTGMPRPLAYERASWWADTPTVHIARRVTTAGATPSDPGFAPLERRPTAFADWTPSDLGLHTEVVEVYSNCEQVELVLNGTSVGALPRPKDDSPRVFRIPFAPGTLKATGTNRGVVVARDALRTAGKAAKLVLTTDHYRLAPLFDDATVVRATVTDTDDNPVPGAADLITFHVTGPGAISAVDNGDTASHEPFGGTHRHAFAGSCIAVLRATANRGAILLTASAPGLTDGAITLGAVPIPEEHP